MAPETLIEAAGHIADGEVVDWQGMRGALATSDQCEIADELQLVAKIAAGHRQLHALLPAAPDAPTDPNADRASWGHLALLDVVGHGSFGTVYRAWDTRLQRLVALKLFHRAPDPDLVMQEGRMLARIRHEHVVTVYGADVIGGVAGIWMELVHGETLDHIVRTKGALTPPEAAAIGADVARALTAIHEAGLLHCDVKAQNVVRETGGRVVLMDLGAGRVIHDDEREAIEGGVAGTPCYMAPELLRTGATATTATDVYGLGVLLYFLVSGQFPVAGRNLAELRQAHLDGKTTPIERVRTGLPPPYVALVNRALNGEPSRRPASAADMAEALQAIVRGQANRFARLAWRVGVIAAAILLAFLTWRVLSPPAAPTVRAIAVLPIRNLTGDPSKSYVADGLTEVLISDLARIRSLRVPSINSVASFRDSTEAPAQLAGRLGVQYFVAGSIMEADTQFQMAVQLYDSATGAAIWGDTIVRDAAGMVSAQAEIARYVAERLTLTLSPEERRGLQAAALNPQAQDAYLHGLAIRTIPTQRREAARLFGKATELEPGFAAAWAQLALVEIPLATESTNADRDQRTALSRQMANKAIALDPTLAIGYAALGTIQFYEDWDFDRAEQTFRTALAVNASDGYVHQNFSFLLAARRRFGDAIQVAQDAVKLEPLVAQRRVVLGGVFYYAREYDRAETEAQMALRVSAEFPTAHFLLGQIAAARGRYDQAIAFVERALRSSDYVGWRVELARIYAAAGRAADARRTLDELTERQRAGESYSADNLAYIAAAEGRLDDAFRILDEAVDSHLINALWIAVDPRVDPLRSDARFDRLLARTGLQ